MPPTDSPASPSQHDQLGAVARGLQQTLLDQFWVQLRAELHQLYGHRALELERQIRPLFDDKDRPLTEVQADIERILRGVPLAKRSNVDPALVYAEITRDAVSALTGHLEHERKRADDILEAFLGVLGREREDTKVRNQAIEVISALRKELAAKPRRGRPVRRA